MQQIINCTMLCSHVVRGCADRWVAELAEGKLRVRIVDVADDAGTAGVGAARAGPAGVGAMLAAIRAQLQGSHLCLLPVCPDNLSWARTLLSQAAGSLPVPVMAVTYDLKAIALRDLLALGVADFIHAPGCPNELRVRVERVLAQSRSAQLDTLSRSLRTAARPLIAKVAEDTSDGRYGVHAAGRRGTDGGGIAETAGTTSGGIASDGAASDGVIVTGAAAASTCTNGADNKTGCSSTVHRYAMGRLVSRTPRRVAEMARAQVSRLSHRQPVPVQHRETALQRSLTACNGLELEAFAAATAARYALRDESFKQAKSKVVDGFEKSYLTAVLTRYGGNIAQSARAAQKDRRAFWELLRKHHIDISLYRALGQVQVEPVK